MKTFEAAKHMRVLRKESFGSHITALRSQRLSVEFGDASSRLMRLSLKGRGETAPATVDPKQLRWRIPGSLGA